MGQAQKLTSELSRRLKLRPNSIRFVFLFNVPGCDWRMVTHLFGDESEFFGLKLVGFSKKRVERFVKTVLDTG